MCSCGKRTFDSKWNSTCRVCWEGVPKEPTQEEMDKAMAIFGEGKLTILESGGSVNYLSSICERCAKSFRQWRKYNIVFDKSQNKWATVCKDCIRSNDIG